MRDPDAACTRDDGHGAFQHEALLYDGEGGFVAGTLPSLRAALASHTPTLVAVGPRKIALLRDALGSDAERVRFEDMTRLGRNPGRIIPAWHAFAAEHADAEALFGIGEPIWAERSAPELAECHRHEALLNLAFATTPGFRLLCPYDTDALLPAVIAEACRNHPHVLAGDGVAVASDDYSGLDAIRAPYAAPLSDPPDEAMAFPFASGSLGITRLLVSLHAELVGLGPARRDDVVLAVNELASNSVRHADGRGTLRLWAERAALVCEVRDAGRIAEPLAGRTPPDGERCGGYGLWLVHQLCDLVELRTLEDGNVVRVHMWR